MSIATLAAWLITASIGGYMLHTWIARGGLHYQRATGVGVPPPVVFGHASVALTGLAVWACYVAARWVALAWLGVGLIGTAITLGICMVTMWTPYPVRIPSAEPEPAQARTAVSSDLGSGEHAFTITDEMIAELLSDPFPATRSSLPGRRRPEVRLLPLIPVGHGFAALATFMLATVTAASGR
ncbi:MAG TPA: hypothetical protein VF070_22610 [Streptosporangiaceae bacterium]